MLTHFTYGVEKNEFQKIIIIRGLYNTNLKCFIFEVVFIYFILNK